MGLDYRVGEKWYRIGTYSEAHYFNEWLNIAGMNDLPLDEGKPMRPDAAAWHLEHWLPRVEELLKGTDCVWAGDEPAPEYAPDAKGGRLIADREYPLRVVIGDQAGIVNPGGFRAGCPPSEFLDTLRHIVATIRKALEHSVKDKQPVHWA